MDKSSQYVVITPAHNEADYIEMTLQSMVCQSLLPTEWVIVDDSSTDNTAKIVEEYMKQYPFIRLVKRGATNKRKLSHSEGLVAANAPASFNFGYKNLLTEDFEYVVKLDADLSFGRNYFETLIQNLDHNPRLGITGGYCYILKDAKFIMERMPSDHVRGPSKIYRRSCLDQIGGIQETLGWDTVDEIKAQMNGWETRSYNDNKLIHLRATGAIDGILKGKSRHGATAYFLGYHPIFLLGRAVYHLFDHPRVLGSAALVYGYISAFAHKKNRVVDADVMKFIRDKQMRRIHRPKTELEVSVTNIE